jgi:hypothetical protein
MSQELQWWNGKVKRTFEHSARRSIQVAGQRGQRGRQLARLGGGEPGQRPGTGPPEGHHDDGTGTVGAALEPGGAVARQGVDVAEAGAGGIVLGAPGVAVGVL